MAITKITNSVLEDNIQLNGTESIGLPSGTTAQRPSSPQAGMFRYNTTTDEFEGYTTEWGAIGGGEASTIYQDTFTGDGSDTTFDLSEDIDTENNTQVFIDGIYQSKDGYSTSGTTITFSEAPPDGSSIEVIHIKAIVLTTVADDAVSTAKIVDDAVTSDKIAADAVDSEHIAEDAVDSEQIADNAVTYDKIGDEFTTRADNVTLSSSTTSTTLDFDSEAVFEVTLPADGTNITLNFANPKIGMTKTILVTNQSTAHEGTISFDVTDTNGGALTGTSTFKRLSSDDFDQTSSTVNYMQITCIDEGSDAGDRTFIYTIATEQ